MGTGREGRYDHSLSLSPLFTFTCSSCRHWPTRYRFDPCGSGTTLRGIEKAAGINRNKMGENFSTKIAILIHIIKKWRSPLNQRENNVVCEREQRISMINFFDGFYGRFKIRNSKQ